MSPSPTHNSSTVIASFKRKNVLGSFKIAITAEVEGDSVSLADLLNQHLA